MCTRPASSRRRERRTAPSANGGLYSRSRRASTRSPGESPRPRTRVRGRQLRPRSPTAKHYSFFISGFYDATAKTIDAFVVEDPFPDEIDFTSSVRSLRERHLQLEADDALREEHRHGRLEWRSAPAWPTKRAAPSLRCRARVRFEHANCRVVHERHRRDGGLVLRRPRLYGLVAGRHHGRFHHGDESPDARQYGEQVVWLVPTTRRHTGSSVCRFFLRETGELLCCPRRIPRRLRLP